MSYKMIAKRKTQGGAEPLPVNMLKLLVVIRKQHLQCLMHSGTPRLAHISHRHHILDFPAITCI